MIAPTGKESLRRMRLSVIWHQNLMLPEAEAQPDVLDGAVYRNLFGIRRGAVGPGLTLPWPPNEHQGFWERYLCRWRTLASVRWRNAWRALVPLRVASPLSLTPCFDAVAVFTEGFLHPWGATFAVTLTIDRDGADFTSAAEQLRELRRDPCFQIAGGGKMLRLDDVATEGLATLRRLVDRPEENGSWEGFSIFSLAAASGPADSFDPAVPEADRFLHAVTSFSDTWRNDALPKIAEAKVAGRRQAPASHLIYGFSRSRAIWSPEHFLATGTSTLSCHHRNLVLASMQTEALSRFAGDTADRLASNRSLSSEHESQAAWAVEILKDLYDGSNKTYRSGSPKAQIDQNAWLADINAVRLNAGLPKIP